MAYATRLIRVAVSVCIVMAMAPATAVASGEMSGDKAAKVPAVGDMTRAALAIQRNGSQAGNLVPLRGEQAAISYKRYLDSFAHPIPQYFGTASANTSSASGAKQ